MTDTTRIERTAAAVRDAGIPDDLNRWVGMTPAQLQDIKQRKTRRIEMPKPAGPKEQQVKALREARGATNQKPDREARKVTLQTAVATAVAATKKVKIKPGSIKAETFANPEAMVKITAAAAVGLDFTRYRHPCLAVACPDCHAKVGVWCKRPSGHGAGELHKQRSQAADAAWEKAGLPTITQTGPQKYVYDVEGVRPGETTPSADAAATPTEKKTMTTTKTSARKSVKKAAAKKAKKSSARRAPAKAASDNARKPKAESKVGIVAALLTRTEGCTGAEVLKATGWPTVSMPQQAKAAGLVLIKEKTKGEPTRYFGTAS